MARVTGFSPPCICIETKWTAQSSPNSCAWVCVRRPGKRVGRAFPRHRFSVCNLEQPDDVQTSLLDEIPASTLPQMLVGTQLESCSLGLLFSAVRDGWDNDVFFSKNALFEGGLPTLLIGRTEAGHIFGGYNAVGFDRRDDFRDSPRFDFGDCAVKFGSGDLEIAMNKRRSLIEPDRARSNLGASYTFLENGDATLFGDTTMATLSNLETFVSQKFIDEAKEIANRKPMSLGDIFGGLFGATK